MIIKENNENIDDQIRKQFPRNSKGNEEKFEKENEIEVKTDQSINDVSITNEEMVKDISKGKVKQLLLIELREDQIMDQNKDTNIARTVNVSQIQPQTLSLSEITKVIHIIQTELEKQKNEFSDKLKKQKNDFSEELEKQKKKKEDLEIKVFNQLEQNGKIRKKYQDLKTKQEIISRTKTQNQITTLEIQNKELATKLNMFEKANKRKYDYNEELNIKLQEKEKSISHFEKLLFLLYCRRVGKAFLISLRKQFFIGLANTWDELKYLSNENQENPSNQLDKVNPAQIKEICDFCCILIDSGNSLAHPE